MMCPENPDNAKVIIDQVLELLDEEHLKHQIDDPIDTAAGQLQFNQTIPFSHRLFHQAISKLVGHIYEQTQQIRLQLRQPLGVAISLLERYYQNGTARGYEAALLDAANSKGGGLDTVTNRIVEIIKTREREKYINWVFACRLSPIDWHIRCKIATILLDRYRDFLSPELRQCRPEQVADEIPALIINHISTEKSLQQIENSALFVVDS